MVRRHAPGCQCCIDECTLNPEDLPYKVTFEGIDIFSEDWDFNPSSDCASYTIDYMTGYTLPAWIELKSAVAKTIVNNYATGYSEVACNRPLIAGCIGTPPAFTLVKTRSLEPYEDYSAADALYLVYRMTSKTISLYKSKVKDCEDAPTSGCLWFATLQINYQYKSTNFRATTQTYGCRVTSESFCCPATPTSSTSTFDDAYIFNYLKSGYPSGLSTFSVTRSHRITEGVSENVVFAENDCIPDCVLDGFAPRCHNWSVCDQEPIVFETTEIVSGWCFLKSITVNSITDTFFIRFISSDAVGAFAFSNCGNDTHYAAVDCLTGYNVSIPNHTLNTVWEDEAGNPCGYSPVLGGACQLDLAPVTVPLCDEPTDPFANECYVRVIVSGNTNPVGQFYFAQEKNCCGRSYETPSVTYTNSGYAMQSITITVPSFSAYILW